MKDAKGHGSNPRESTYARSDAWAAHQQAIIQTLRDKVLPDFSRVTRAPRLIEWLAANKRKP